LLLIAGLGNPGRRYEGTRHNIGFRVLDDLAVRHCISIDRRKYKSYIGSGEIKGVEILLVKPQTFMNLSGRAVKVIKDDLGLEIFKIPSGEITNLPYLRAIAKLNKKVILSTGMATMEEVKDALNILTEGGTRKQNITILHANSMYPSPMEDVNLRAMQSIQKELDVAVGYSDHTLGIEVDIAAVAMGASVIEKHFTLDKTMQGPDHKASLEPDELKAMVSAIRNIEKALGSSEKKPSPSEMPNREVARKSIVAACDIQKGEILSEKNLTTKRPAKGLSPMVWDSIIGSVAEKDYKEDDLI